MILYWSLAFFLSLSSTTTAAYSSKESEKPAPEPCTIRSPTSGAFFDLNPLHILDPAESKVKGARDHSWNATGWDLGYNFTMNFCGGVIEDVQKDGGFVGVDKELWRNVSAYYKKDGKLYSLGLQNTAPVIRGRKLVLNYTDGSPCDTDRNKRTHAVEDIESREIIDGDGDRKGDKDTSPSTRRKSTIVSMLCEKDPLMPLLHLSFVAASPDQCTYFFEARTSAACAGIEQAVQTLSPGGVFGIIVLIAVIVYVVGGCVYSRVVLQQRGWKQLPNYHLWAGIFGMFKDLFIIIISSCTRLIPSRRGYQRVNGGLGGTGSGWSSRRRDADAENRLIDDFNEEWDD